MWEEKVARAKRLVPRYHHNAERRWAVLQRMLAGLRRRGRVSALLLDTPVNPRFVREGFGEDFYAAHRQRMRQWARRSGLAYLNINEAANLQDEDFFDHYHLSRREAQQRCTAALAAKVAEVLAGPGPQEEPS